MPEGRQVIFASGKEGFFRLWRAAAFARRDAIPVPVASEDAAFPTLALGRAGGRSRLQLAYAHGRRSSIIWNMERRSGSVQPPSKLLSASSQIDSSPQLSPDGGRIVFSSNRSGFEEIWVCESSGLNAARLTSLRGSAGSPRWSPSGRQIAFDYLNEDGRTIYVVGAEGGPVRRLTGWGDMGRPSWARDGRWVYYFTSQTGRFEVWKVPAGGSQQTPPSPVQVTRDGGFEAYESLDGVGALLHAGP
jgi:Tol biopolymer transport system component